MDYINMDMWRFGKNNSSKSLFEYYKELIKIVK